MRTSSKIKPSRQNERKLFPKSARRVGNFFRHTPNGTSTVLHNRRRLKRETSRLYRKRADDRVCKDVERCRGSDAFLSHNPLIMSHPDFEHISLIQLLRAGLLEKSVAVHPRPHITFSSSTSPHHPPSSASSSPATSAIPKTSRLVTNYPVTPSSRWLPPE